MFQITFIDHCIVLPFIVTLYLTLYLSCICW